MITFEQCPVCRSNEIAAVFSAKDHTVSGESFVVTNCNACSFRFTQDAPSQNKISRYYQSENYVSHSDTQKGFVNRLYHAVRKRTLRSKRNLVQRTAGKRHGSLLDVGCGTGAFVHTMKKANWDCTGLEPGEAARQKAKQLYGVDAMPPDHLFNLPFASFDVITMWHVLEHVHPLHEYILQLGNLLKPGGKLLVAVPNYPCYDAKHYGSDWAAYDVPRHLWHFSPMSMKKLLTQHGLVIENMQPMWYDSFYVSLLSEKYKYGKGNVLRAFFIGLWSNLKAVQSRRSCSSLIYVIAKA